MQRLGLLCLLCVAGCAGLELAAYVLHDHWRNWKALSPLEQEEWKQCVRANLDDCPETWVTGWTATLYGWPTGLLLIFSFTVLGYTSQQIGRWLVPWLKSTLAA